MGCVSEDGAEKAKLRHWSGLLPRRELPGADGVAAGDSALACVEDDRAVGFHVPTFVVPGIVGTRISFSRPVGLVKRFQMG